jgi:beta-lactamase class C
MAAGDVPGLGVLIARHSQPAQHLWIGVDGNGVVLQPDTIFPVASITKLAVALAILRQSDDERLSLDDPLAYHLPEAAAAIDGVTIRTLLCHTSGLPTEIPRSAAPYAPGLDWPRLAEACLALEPRRSPNTQVEYSNPGYGLLALVLERSTGLTFTAALERLVFAPLGIEAYLGVEPPRPPAVLTGIRRPTAGGEIEVFNSAFWRSLALPWAGLLTTGDGALTLVRGFYDKAGAILHPQTRAEAVRNQTGDLDCRLFGLIPWQQCHWGLGPELRDHKSPHWAPPEAGVDSFGHAGQSGCLAWADPHAGVAWAILGTRVADNGWLIRHAAAIGSAILSAQDGVST